MVRRKSNPVALRERLADRGLLGTFVKLPALETIDLLASRADFAIVDLEHSQLSTGQALTLVRHAFALDLPTLARVPSCDAGLVNRMLEAGATGIQLSSVRSTRDVEELVLATRYPPRGRRSVSLAQPAAGFGSVSLGRLVRGDPPLLVGQIETAETEDPLDEMLGAGLDVAFVGTTDLLVDVGMDRDRMASAVEEIGKAALAANIPLGAFAATPDDIPEWAGYVALSSDVSMLLDGIGGVLGAGRAALEMQAGRAP
jgi:4-hydroxy-2-oxoheptanedioate aldolase